MRRRGSRESTTRVAEQLALGHLRRNRCAVETHERGRMALAAGVQQRRQQLLARTGLALYQHRHVAARKEQRAIDCAPKGRSAPDERTAEAGLCSAAPSLTPQRPRLERAGHHRLQLVELERLG